MISKYKIEGVIREIMFRPSNSLGNGKLSEISFTLNPASGFSVEIEKSDGKSILMLLAPNVEDEKDARLVKPSQRFLVNNSWFPSSLLLDLKLSKAKVRVYGNHGQSTLKSPVSGDKEKSSDKERIASSSVCTERQNGNIENLEDDFTIDLIEVL